MGLFRIFKQPKKKSYADGVYMEVPKLTPEQEKRNERIILCTNLEICDGNQFHALVKVVLKLNG